MPDSVRRGWSLARYSLTRKRTAVYRLDREARDLVPLVDLPSCGDTAFAGAVELAPGRFEIVNYSSPIDGVDWPWLGGQLTGSRLYFQELTIAPK